MLELCNIIDINLIKGPRKEFFWDVRQGLKDSFFIIWKLERLVLHEMLYSQNWSSHFPNTNQSPT